ncbi:PDZ domain-containing protein [Ancylomarina sp. 16SWW S1-10-2]|uniref:PDZ domain-containing protein n=1 Tax=Ancylomarina sp. 16SWW S1-10-2 TaxID=2499681 RepID=UPI0012ADBB6A|nr:PDZ domain-containing protein [Ancylomarina sp. 16SWW S1-10-2]MRT93803.1 PDZ domain-containing protein [Ancylomarina sp. 16SWW S1-10-2]
MRKLFLLLMGCIFLFFSACKPKVIRIVVDSTLQSEESVALLDKAWQQAKQVKKEDSSALIEIIVHPGEYNLKSPLVITPELNGTSIIGAGSDKVSIKGSVPLDLKWKSLNENVYEATIAENLDFDQLIADGKVQILARYPNYNEDGGMWQGYAKDAISIKRIASWKNPIGAYFNTMHKGKWGGFHFRITGVNADGTAILEGGQQNNRPSAPHTEYRMVENVFEELDSAGEWYLDREKHKLYYWPQKGMDIQKLNFEASVLKSLIEIKGSLENPVKNITIQGIKFEHTQRTFMEEYEPLLRSDWTIYRGGAVFFEGTENCSIEDCEFTNLGGNVIFASAYNKGLKIAGNHIHDCGASAICFVGDASAVRSPAFQYGQFVALDKMDTISGPQNELYPRECIAENNLIHRIGRIEKQTAGVQISMAMDITVRHNSIYDVPRAGINIGDGTWGGHILEYNDVFNTVLESGDHGSFNSWGRDRFWHPKRHVMDSMTTANPNMPKWDAIHTTIIRNNRFRCDHGWDIDLDDGSTNYHIYNNLCLNRGIKLREGFYRVVENNIIVNNSLHPHVWFANSEDVFKKNIVGDAYQDVGLLGWGKELDYNLFPNEESMLKSQIYDRDMNSAFGDPLFKNPEHLDFIVAENSPALKLGFVNFPMDQFGVQKPAYKAIAKTPEVPVLKDSSISNGKSSPVVAWLRNNIKSVDTEAEQSAYGLNMPEGVILLSVWKHSPAVKGNGLKKRDVILEVEGVKIKSSLDFLKITKKYQKLGKIHVVVMRNQAEQNLFIQIN